MQIADDLMILLLRFNSEVEIIEFLSFFLLQITKNTFSLKCMLLHDEI